MKILERSAQFSLTVNENPGGASEDLTQSPDEKNIELKNIYSLQSHREFEVKNLN